MDALTKKLAQHAEGAFLHGRVAGRDGDRLSAADAGRGGNFVRVPKWRVLDLAATFVVDRRNRKWFSHAADVTVAAVPAPRSDPASRWFYAAFFARPRASS